MKINANDLKRLVAIYWRFARHHFLVAYEYRDYDYADVISVSKGRKVVCETEIKMSIADLKQDKRKSKHSQDAFGKSYFAGDFVDFFYFAIPERLLEKAMPLCNEMFPYAGILVVQDYKKYLSSISYAYTFPPVYCAKQPQKVKQRPMTDDEFMKIVRGMSNKLCRLAFENMRYERGIK